MGTVRGRAVLDFVRHRVGWTATGSFDTREFWEQSYAKRGLETHEWALRPRDLLDYEFRDASVHRPAHGGVGAGRLADHCPKGGRTLLLGAGTSALGSELGAAGWTRLTAADFSEVAVRDGARREPGVDWRAADARRLGDAFPDASFDAVLDKGTVDAIYLAAAESHAADVAAVARGVHGLLAPPGAFTCVSLSGPDYLWPLLHADPGLWDRAVSEVRRLDGAYLYLLWKTKD
mmetsp:Transcript_4713/g.13980  ORF Transcript_4713/g.13980 Transcript_4713/m.13980 type:complete len:233 (+) Transcript_4713:215-913(+)